jgi:ATP-dependent helicase HrpB
VVLQAPPGAGKTTRVPLALLEETWLAGQTLLMLEPRRLAARTACARMAGELGESVGDTVGYRIRFDTQISARTRIEVLTEGILTRRLQQDPGLEGVGLVIFDEYHERSLHADLALALCLDAQAGLREDLKILVMSATLDGAAVARLLSDAPIVRSEGRAWPVEISYLPMADEKRIADNMSQALLKILPQTQGDVLAFLPGTGEIRRVAQNLEAGGLPPELDLVPLYGDLSKQEQDHAIRPAPPGRRKLVLATPIAETSLTIEGVGVVVDSGWQRRPAFDPRSGLSKLVLQRISQASADQRAGRAGRLGPGKCFRLWSQSLALRPQTPPEILDADLAPLALELAAWGVADPLALAWFDPPPPGALAQARDLLRALDALDGEGRISELGRRMAAWPVHPRLAHLLCRAEEFGWQDLACDLAALLSERDILRRGIKETDLELRLRVLQAFREQGRAAARRLEADAEGCGQVVKLSRELRRRFRSLPPGGGGVGRGGTMAGILLAFAYPDRIARRRGLASTGSASGAATAYRLSNGRGAILPEGDPLGKEEWLVVADLDAGEREARIYLAAGVRLAELREYLAEDIRWETTVAWENGAVAARREEKLGSLVLSSENLQDVPEDARRAALLQGIRQAGLQVLPWTPATRQWQARVECLRQWLPEDTWPPVNDKHLLDTLEEWLGPYLDKINRLGHLQQLDLAGILQNLLDWPQQQGLAREAPTHLDVPSGSHIRLEYQLDAGPPVLAVRLQEMFGLADTPTLAKGRIKVMLHLLSPAQRPIQVTQDLKSFWERTYQEVKKELKGRYPKHYWPDDPWQAVATRRVKPREKT